FPRVTTLKDAADAERERRALERIRHGVMTIEQAKQMLTRGWSEVPVDRDLGRKPRRSGRG
ncbi:MAG TPA: hypothetical protein VF737_16245, partial [Gemmatimonadaceae bacterium]